MGKLKVFTSEDKRRLKEAQRKLADLLPECDSAEACGVDVTVARSLLENIQETLGQVEQRFMGPDRLRKK